jgi:phosphoglycerate kinase
MVGTLDDLAVRGTRIGVRVDINSPVTDSGALADDARLQAHVQTLSELLERGGRVAILAHQGRPGGEEFVTLESHARRLDELLEAPVSYVDTNLGQTARDAIRDLSDGEAVVLENTRFYAEEYVEFEPERAGRTHLVEGLVDVLDVFVNDAFAAAHRSQPSIVGFPDRLPAYAGRVMERELDVLGGIDETPSPRMFLLGGAKVADSIDVAWNVFGRGIADEVLVSGVVGNVFLFADGVALGDASADFVDEQGYWDQVDRARDLLDAHGDRIHLPRDVAVERDGQRHEIGINLLPPKEGEAAMDVGSATVDYYRTVLDRAETVVVNGPAGVFEDERFEDGTRELFATAATVDTSIVGGGDTASAIRRLGIDGFTHVSTGGGAALKMLTGEDLPAVAALEAAPRVDTTDAD